MTSFYINVNLLFIASHLQLAILHKDKLLRQKKKNMLADNTEFVMAACKFEYYHRCNKKTKRFVTSYDLTTVDLSQYQCP